MAPRHEGMNQGGTGQPRKEGTVLDGVPAPVAAPAQYLVSPVGPQQQPTPKYRPGHDCPRPRDLGPGYRASFVRARLVRGHKPEAQARVEVTLACASGLCLHIEGYRVESPVD